ncbi:MAG: FtsL-like putative cell division protein [Bacteroidota bacterium]|nr:FtsL-like putative cell division protein [Bacteroidota bacterium]
MANKFKEIQVEEEEVIEQVEKPKAQAKPTSPKKKSGVVKSLNSVFSGTFLSNDFVLKRIPFVLFLSVVAVFYISYNYWADDKLRQQSKITSQLKELRSEYIASKSDLMFVSKQSEVAKAVESMGLKEPVVPPMKIVVQQDSVNQK